MAAESSLPSGFGTRPWLVQGTRGERQTFVDSSDGSSHATVVPEMQGKTCLGCIHNGDWLLMLDESTSECFLLHLSDDEDDDPSKKIPLPPLHEQLESIQTCASLGASPAQPDCAVVVSIVRVEEYTVERFLIHCRPGDEHWAKLESPKLCFPSLMISHRGQIYCFGASDTLFVIGDDNGTVQARQIGTLGGTKEVHDRSAMYYVVESCGDLFLVVTEQFGDFSEEGVLTGIMVYRLDLKSMMWRRVHSIGSDHAFLVSGHYGYSVPVGQGAGGLVPQGNCVYLVLSSCDCERLYSVCLDDMTISFCQILPHPTEPWCRAFWAVPPLATVVKEIELLNTDSLIPEEVCESISILKLEEEEQQQQATSWNTRPWQDLPLELLELVVSELSLVDCLRFPAVCKSWSMVSNPVEQAKVWPWLMHWSGRDGVCKLFDPLRCQEYTIGVGMSEDEDNEHIFRFSKDGWVAVSTNPDIDDIYLINPFTEDTVEVAMLEGKYNYMGFSWSSVDPTSIDCVFFGVNSRHDGKAVGVHTWRHGQNRWVEHHLEYYEGASFPVAYTNPVLFHGKFYCLGRMGNLATFDMASDTWTILEKPNPIHVELDVEDKDRIGREFCNLVEVGGELVSVFVRNANEPPRVFKLNEEEMVWTEVQDIGGAALFLDIRVSFSVVSPETGHGNRIYFPRYSNDGKQAAFYDMETKVYHPSFYGLRQPLRCVWVVPNLRPHI